MRERGHAFPFEHVRRLMAGSDIRFGNLELPLTERVAATYKDYVFRAPPSSVDALTGAGFNVLSLANNHALDYGSEGLLDTLATLERAGIAGVGAGRSAEEARRPAVLTVKGVRVAFLAYTNTPNDSISGWNAAADEAGAERPGVAWGRAEDIRRDVAAARAGADVVIVSLHSGFEYTATPNPRQRELARASVDAGAALVLGGHPHVLQGVEFYRGAPIIYSLGNFVFDLDDDDRRQPGLPSVLTTIFRVTLTKQGVTSVRFLPAVIDQREGRPTPVSGDAATPVLARLYRLTDGLN
jgi:poly-gamma-glutamate synthesis protein (capsule biosynthesis protein)